MSFEFFEPVRPLSPDDITRRRMFEQAEKRLGLLSPGEIVAAARLLEKEYRREIDLGDMSPYMCYDDVVVYVHDLSTTDQERAVGVLSAFVESPLAGDRRFAVPQISSFSRANPEAGVTLWSRLMGDPDEEVRDWAKESLEDCLATASAGDLGYLGFVTIAALDEPRFIERVGLTRPDAYDLYLSYAYAENGQYFDLGRAALAMVNDLAPPSSDGPASAI